MGDDQNISNTQAALDFAQSHTEPQTIVVAVPGGESEEVLVTTGEDGTSVARARDLFADLIPAPPRRKGTLEVHDLESFLLAVNRDSDAGSVIFADSNKRELTAVLDYHEAGREGPRWGQDRVVYGFQLSQQLAAWVQASRSTMTQKDFARLIDDRLGDIGAGPVGEIAAEFAARRGIRFATVADLVVFTRNISAKSTTDSEELYDEDTGGTSIQYKKKNDVKAPDGTPVAVPQAFCLQIPVFRGSGASQFSIAVRLRYDIGEKGIAWRVELHALDKYLLAAMEEQLVTVRAMARAGGESGPLVPVLMAAAPAPM